MSFTTSITLLRALQSPSDDAAWRRFLSIYQPLLETWLERIGVPADLADDVRQDVLVKVHQEIPRFQHNGNSGAFRAWLRAILANRLRTVLRQKGRQPQPLAESLAEQLASDNSELTQRWNKEHDAHLIERLLELIAADFQATTLMAFRRVVLQQQPAASVAEELNMTVNAVRIAQSRVLAALRVVGEGLLD